MKKLNTFSEYKSAYKQSVDDPEGFWSEIAKNFKWKKKIIQNV